MNLARRITHFTEDEYIARERVIETKHEFVNGEIFAMFGARLRHNLIASSTIASLCGALRNTPCRVFNSDQRIAITATGAYTYADAGVVCGRPELHPKDDMALVNPALLVEVLSKSTASYDRGEKLSHYRRQPSVQEILIVWQSEIRVERHRRVGDYEWLVTEHAEGEIELRTLGGSIALADLYAQVDWSQPEDTA